VTEAASAITIPDPPFCTLTRACLGDARMAQTWMIGTLLALRTSVTETHSRGDA